jgi:hypothetical protein
MPVEISKYLRQLPEYVQWARSGFSVEEPEKKARESVLGPVMDAWWATAYCDCGKRAVQLNEKGQAVCHKCAAAQKEQRESVAYLLRSYQQRVEHLELMEQVYLQEIYELESELEERAYDS